MTQAIEHIVLLKVKDNTDPTKVTSMITELHNLVSLDQVLYLSAGPVHKNRSSSFIFIHILHCRFTTKEDLGIYATHPAHVRVVKEYMLPICEDILTVDWVADLDEPIAHPFSGDVMRVSLLKLKGGLGQNEKEEVLKAVGGVKGKLSSGENFSPARAKGFLVLSLAVFPGLSELETSDSNEVVKGFLNSVIVVDYVGNLLLGMERVEPSNSH